MGLKLKKFRANLTWKSKKPPPEVVCLRYQSISEFEEPLRESIPLTTSEVAARLRTSDVIKQRKLAPKLPVHSVFQNDSGKSTNNSNSNATASTSMQPPPQPKGILKKSNPDALQQLNLNSTETEDDYKKSALIFMTENHDDNVIKAEPQTENARRESNENNKTDSIVVVENQKTSSRLNEIRVNNNVETELNGDHAKMLTTSDFQVHVVDHKDSMRDSGNKSESEEEDESETDTGYGSRSGYSSQAASIFFAGEEPEPTPRIRKVVQDDSDSEVTNA